MYRCIKTNMSVKGIKSKGCSDLLFHQEHHSAFLLAQKPLACSSNSISQDGSLAIFSCNLHHKNPTSPLNNGKSIGSYIFLKLLFDFFVHKIVIKSTTEAKC